MSYFLLLIAANLHPHIDEEYEGGVYSSYMKSIVDDYDLNIINNVNPEMAWIVSNTYNFPDMHDHGASVIWAPFYFVFEKINSIVPLHNIKLFGTDKTLPFSSTLILILSLFLGLLGIKSSRIFANDFLDVQIPTFHLFAVVFCTGLFNFLIYQCASADITLFAYAAVLYLVLINQNHHYNKFHLFCLGSLLSFGSVIKITFPILIPSYAYLLYRNRNKYSAADYAFFLFGFLLVLLYKLINNSIKFGMSNLFQGYDYAYKIEYFFSPIHHWKSFFGPAGVFVIAPIFFIFLVYFIFLLYQSLFNYKKISDEHRFFLITSLSVFSKFYLALIVIFDAYTGFGQRPFVMDTCLLVFMLGMLYKYKEQNPILNKFTTTVISFSIVSTSVIYLWWIALNQQGGVPSFNAYFIQDLHVPYEQLLKICSNFSELVIKIGPYFYDNIVYLLPLSLFVGIWVLFDLLIQKKNYSLLLKYFFIYIFVTYSVTTGLNLYYNSKNVNTMKSEKYFDKMVVGNGPHVYLYDEYVSAITYGMEISKYENDLVLYNYLKGLLTNLMDQSGSEVTSDPINFASSLKSHQLKELTIEHHDKPINDVMSFEKPTRIKIW